MDTTAVCWEGVLVEFVLTTYFCSNRLASFYRRLNSTKAINIDCQMYATPTNRPRPGGLDVSTCAQLFSSSRHVTLRSGASKISGLALVTSLLHHYYVICSRASLRSPISYHNEVNASVDTDVRRSLYIQPRVC